jgi:diaminopimelate decarboxylase
MERLAELTRALRTDGHAIKYVDAGGGLGIAYDNQSLPDFAEHVASYAEALLRPLRDLKVHLLLEPGRCIVGPAGALLTRLLYKKTNGAKKFLVVDAAMNDLLRPSLYRAYHEIVPVLASDQSSSDQGAGETVDVVGPICETGDFFARDRQLPIMQEGDLLALLDAGAYGMVLASNYNTRPRPAEVLVDGKSVKVIRQRETIADLVQSER